MNDATSGNLPVVLVTGASTGIGRAIASLLAQKGYQVFGTSRKPDKTQAIPGVMFLPLDLTSAQSIENCIHEVMKRTGRIDVLVNNAGLLGPAGASEEMSIEAVRDLFEANFFGVVQMVNAVLPILREQGGGTIINISSTCGLVSAPPFFSFYAASKHALEGYTEGLRYEVQPFNIHVALVEPGYTSTEISATVAPPEHPSPAYQNTRERVTRLSQAGIKYGSPVDIVAQAVLKIINQSAPTLRHPTGSDSLAILIARRLLPYPLFERLVASMFFSWRPRTRPSAIPTPSELGLVHRSLFHNATLTRLLQLAGLAAASLAAVVLWRRRG